MRNKKFFAFLAALAVLIASPAVLFGADANSDIKTYVNGKELDEIDDILKEANGGKTSLPKHSLMILQISSPGKNNQTDTGKLSYRFLPFNADGTAMTNYDNFNTPFGNETEFNNYNVGVHSPVASYLSGKGRGRYVFIHDKPAIGKATFNAQLYLIEKENGVGENDKAPTVTKIGSTINKNLGEYSNSISKYCYIMDAKSGLVVDPDNPDEEFFAVSTLCDAQMGNVSGNSYPVICFFKISEDEDGKAAFSEELLTIKETANSPYTPAQIAVGDFMGTGMNNQVALVFSNSDSVVLKIYTIKKNAAGALIYESTRTDTVYKYKTAIGNFDGLYSFPVADIAAGDFDGDGKKELAITYKPVTYRPETNVSDADGEKIAMKIYKWQNGAFKTEETTTKCYYYSGGGKVVQSGVTWFKPVAADLDGDGKDELAVVVSIWGYTHSKGILFAKDTYRVKSDLHMTFWSCAAGSIKPVFKGPQIFANGSNSELNRFTYFYPTGQTETNVGAEMGYPFPYMPRSISVVAGPFRGAVGKYRTKDDVIVSFQDTYLGYGNNDAKRDNNIMLFWPKNNNFNGWNYKKFSSGKNNLNGLGIGLVASDFMHEGAELGDVRHLVVSDRKTCAAIIQAQPYHFDVIPLPWENDTTPVATNFNYEPKARTIYSRSGESSRLLNHPLHWKG